MRAGSWGWLAPPRAGPGRHFRLRFAFPALGSASATTIMRNQRHGRRRAGPGILVTGDQQFGYFFFLQWLFVTQQVSHERYLGEVLYGFHLHVGALQVLAVSH